MATKSFAVGMPPDPKSLVAQLKTLDKSSFKDSSEKTRFLDELKQVVNSLSQPSDLAFDHVFGNGACVAAISTLVEAGAFTKWEEEGADALSCTELSDLIGIDVVLLRRLCRLLASYHLLEETGADDTYARTSLAVLLGRDASVADLYNGPVTRLFAQTWGTLPLFLKDQAFRNPTDVDRSNFQYCKGEGTNLFQYLGSDPELLASFHACMEYHNRHGVSPWPDLFPIGDVIAPSQTKPGRVLVVEVGGGKGKNLKLLLARFPTLPEGSLVLQDLPEVVADVAPDQANAISIRPYDFFTPEPVIGARVYLFHIVLHDWPDDTAERILKNTAGAMEMGYSKLIIYEAVVSTQNPDPKTAAADLLMMALLSAKERTESDWNKLLARAGLRVVKIWSSPQCSESIIEAELA